MPDNDRYRVKGTGAAFVGPGGYANTGNHIGDVYISPLPRSGYRYQVELIAPKVLEDREAELEELARFCTVPGGPDWVWWQGPAWSGKSAVMPRFVLDSPPDVRVASFFITARFAAQSDYIAFTDVLLVQLAEIAGQPLLTSTDATRHGDLLRMLHAAAVACREQGQRFVLVVDGLDEDRGVTTGPDAYSITGLLPARPPEGMRIIVSGRPDPPLPGDVPSRHPLRDPGIVRYLRPSAYAQVIRHEAVREPKRLLDGMPIQQDLLGLIAASGGGLSIADPAELTDRPELDVADHLAVAFGRSFSTRLARWRGETVYVLAHEELQDIAIQRLGEARLADYRSRLHSWADRYRNRRWAPGIPEYLLRGYFRLLQATNDLPRMIETRRTATGTTA